MKMASWLFPPCELPSPCHRLIGVCCETINTRRLSRERWKVSSATNLRGKEIYKRGLCISRRWLMKGKDCATKKKKNGYWVSNFIHNLLVIQRYCRPRQIKKYVKASWKSCIIHKIFHYKPFLPMRKCLRICSKNSGPKLFIKL